MNTTLPDPDGDMLADGAAQPDMPTDAVGDETERPGGRFTGWLRRPDDGIVGGVAIDLADRLQLDVLWVRLAFVVLLLVGGLGAVVYGGLWLAFVIGAEHRGARIAGGVILLAGVPLLIANADLGLANGTGAVIVLLVGLTLALWNRGPEPVPQVRQRASGTEDLALGELVERVDREAALSQPRPARNRSVRTRTSRPPSILGRATFGAAVVVAAAGALIDELNGGRLHPEQWLGAAAVVCGVGLLVGAVRGHARWLIIPAVVFGAAGYVGGESAGVGLTLADVGGGDSYHYIGDYSGGNNNSSMSSVFGSSVIDVSAVPAEQARVEALSAFGNISISATNDATIELIARADGGEVDINGLRVADGTHRVGPAGEPDVIIDARTLHGEIMLFTFDPDTREDVIYLDELEPEVSTTIGAFGAGSRPIGEGVAMTMDGTTILLDVQGLIGPDDQPLLGDWFPEDETRLVWPSDVGTWQLLGGVLVTPFGEVLDLDAIRSEVLGSPGETVPESVLPNAADAPVAPAEPLITTTSPNITIAPQEG